MERSFRTDICKKHASIADPFKRDLNVDTDRLKKWFHISQRDLPWRKGRSPYKVWISEIMLQQTRASVVISYFERWMEAMPTIHTVADASEEQLIKLWEGLGYYSRVRMIHRAAQMIVTKHGGIFPSTQTEIAALPGIGNYTTAAIASFAFHQKAAAVDGNVARVISRLFALNINIEKKLIFQEIVQSILPNEEPWIAMEALIELGALVCKSVPVCNLCPLKIDCQAYQNDRIHLFPVRKLRPDTVELERDVWVIIGPKALLLHREQHIKLMQGLYEFPYASRGAALPFDLSLRKIGTLEKEIHSFTRYKAHLYPSIWASLDCRPVAGYEWVEIAKIKDLAFSSGHRKILQKLGIHEYFTH